MEFAQSSLASASSLFFLSMSTNIGTDFEVTFSISPYVTPFSIGYLIILFDLPSLQNDYPQYLFTTSQWVNTGDALNKPVPFDCLHPF